MSYECGEEEGQTYTNSLSKRGRIGNKCGKKKNDDHPIGPVFILECNWGGNISYKEKLFII